MTDRKSKYLFESSLIPDSISAKVRPLQRSDYARGFLTCLSDLTWIGEVDQKSFEERFDWLATVGRGWNYCIVIDDGDKIVATATMIVDRKFIQNLTTVAHVEDVSVLATHQRKGLGLLLLKALEGTAKNLGVKKLILDCGDRNVGFYERCGYTESGHHMSLDCKD
ncbi:hypothetical protein AUEXF2481DRAFT_45061 [Aureobasidium subglaciale EXF-2481]|uniref:Glucosamine 6-phosphate N-acetyltransferase n=1 Tax=Aureobasidium subglaciale (strain EXF-2481) TaxID=1043005 RepID=A0A074Y8F8_AURSE|nr:uncharacterized protein AUEXF2481DRAFT_45061 [Aureobasidium subglaciale EXF-2481]KAI5201914.1 hypothetical protein E4T38_05863 [Aureobasidium subglaciale]KAI5220874.1 hypothetical protein E4T40_05794 [Aureobasidium subglaciale]KAI5224684.1 hypothetical protein E4T41_05547 [Aureobasidium subglaciale]KAI5260872.1 hypothetical protein E4T46_05617 [Aureobasidium subglaciale]KEQ90502.1 hypothetical protein AUEXF2481DRAFT_45061 [Aureobasidium subglaciale EXF-2481]